MERPCVLCACRHTQPRLTKLARREQQSSHSLAAIAPFVGSIVAARSPVAPRAAASVSPTQRGWTPAPSRCIGWRDRSSRLRAHHQACVRPAPTAPGLACLFLAADTPRAQLESKWHCLRSAPLPTTGESSANLRPNDPIQRARATAFDRACTSVARAPLQWIVRSQGVTPTSGRHHVTRKIVGTSSRFRIHLSRAPVATRPLAGPPLLVANRREAILL